MNITNTHQQFGLVSKLIHWLMAALFIAIIAIALYMDELPRGAEKFEWMSLHKALGACALAAVLLRIVWHRITKAPTPLGDGWQLKLAHLGHVALYLLMLIMPISGLIMSLAGGHDVSVFSWFTLSGFSEKNETLGGIASFIHHNAANLLYLVLLLHVAAALYHHFILKDNTLKRITSA